jgi:hypothetical protein
MKIAGTAHVRANGIAYSTGVEEGFKINGQNIVAEAVKDCHGRTHYTEKPVAASIEGQFLMTDNLNPSSVTGLRDVTVQIDFGNSKMFVLYNAIYTGDGSVDTKDGKFSVKFEGNGAWM